MRTPVEDAVIECGLFPRGTRVLAAVSGGADSMAMVDALHRHTGALGIELAVASFDHHLRAQSTREVAQVGAWCGERGIPFRAGEGDVTAHARSTGASIEASARTLRYAFLETAAGETGAARIATGHTRDDQVETVLMRLEHGAGIRGLVGIHRERGAIVRPLLDVTRDHTVLHCTERDIAFVNDPANEDMRFERNRVRHGVLPEMRVRNPETDTKLLRIRAAALDAVTRIRARTTPLLESAVVHEGDAWVVDASALAGLGGRERYVFFGDLLGDRIGIGDRPGRQHYRELAALCEADTPSGRMTSFPGGCARREYDAVVVFPGVREPAAPGTTGEAPVAFSPGERARFGGRTVVSSQLTTNSLTDNELRATGETSGPMGSTVAYFDAGALELPLRVRYARPGDRMRPFGMAGRRSIGDILSDRKSPPRRRRHALVVEDQRRIVWLVGITTCDSTRVNPGTRRIVRVDVDGVTAPE